MRRKQKKSTAQEESLIALDDLMEAIKDPKFQDEEQQKDLKSTLDEAIAQLEGQRADVIRMLYFEGLSPKEVAQKLGKTVGAIYSLHFNALRDLKKILNRNRDKFNE
jgi:RNA polymerase sigma factor (sigma-70 family)